MAVRAVVAAGVAAVVALAGCDEPVPEQPRPPVTQPPPSSATRCTFPGARDAGDARPSLAAPRTLVLRRRELPSTFDFDSPVGVERLTLEGADIDALLDRGRYLDGASVRYRAGGDPCNPRTRAVAAVLVFEDADGARLAARRLDLVASGVLRWGRPGGRTRRLRGAVPGADEALRLRHQADLAGELIANVLVWRHGRAIGLVSIEGMRRSPDAVLLPQVAHRQAAWIAAAR